MRGLLVGVVALLSLMFIGSLTSPVRAAGQIESLDLQATLQPNGQIEVIQKIDLGTTGSLTWKLYSKLNSLTIQADSSTLDTKGYRLHSFSGGTKIETNTKARFWVLSYVATNSLIRHNDRDQFFLKVFELPNVNIDQISAKFRLSQPVDASLLAGNSYVLGGVIGAESKINSGQDFIYSADLAGPNSLMTINASWPKSVLNLSSSQEIRLALSNLDSLPWVVLGISLPLTSLIVLLLLLWRQHRQDQIPTRPATDKLPTTLSPLIVGVLVRKKIYPEEVVALLVDLCQRGYLVIIKRNDDYFLGARRLPDEFLQTWERNILEQIIPDIGTKLTDEELKRINKQSLFSPQIRSAYSEVYEIITRKHYFAENPHLTRIRYKLFGLAFYFVAVFGVIWTTVTEVTPYLLIPLAGTLIIAWLILRFTPGLINYTPTGNVERAKWLAFAEFLSQSEPLDPQLVRNHTFEKYLPYAIALNQASAWADRFDRSESVIIRPDWFISYQDLTAAQLSKELADFTGKISRMISGLRGPLVN